MVRFIIRTDRRAVPDAPIVTSYDIIDINLPAIEERIQSGGYNEDGTFEVSRVFDVDTARRNSGR